ncbi:MAG: hypothetical protein ACFE9I_04130 [Candidatus Hermodarchaeota archaeon]
MNESVKFDKKFRNLALIILIIASFILTIWIVLYLNSPELASPLLISIGIALLLAGILLFTRIQYIIWMKTKY